MGLEIYHYPLFFMQARTEEVLSSHYLIIGGEGSNKMAEQYK